MRILTLAVLHVQGKFSSTYYMWFSWKTLAQEILDSVEKTTTYNPIKDREFSGLNQYFPFSDGVAGGLCLSIFSMCHFFFIYV